MLRFGGGGRRTGRVEQGEGMKEGRTDARESASPQYPGQFSFYSMDFLLFERRWSHVGGGLGRRWSHVGWGFGRRWSHGVGGFATVANFNALFLFRKRSGDVLSAEIWQAWIFQIFQLEKPIPSHGKFMEIQSES